MKISLIAARARNGVIGRENRIPWRLARDMRRFKRLTMGHCLLMGRLTYESLVRPLPGRRIIVLSRRPGYEVQGVETAASLGEAIEMARGDDEVFIGGGEEIYRQTMAIADRIYLTTLHQDFEGDALFPELTPNHWRLTWEMVYPSGPRRPIGFTFQDFDRAPRP